MATKPPTSDLYGMFLNKIVHGTNMIYIGEWIYKIVLGFSVSSWEKKLYWDFWLP